MNLQQPDPEVLSGNFDSIHDIFILHAKKYVDYLSLSIFFIDNDDYLDYDAEDINSNQISTFSELNSISSLLDSVFISPYKKFVKSISNFKKPDVNEVNSALDLKTGTASVKIMVVFV